MSAHGRQSDCFEALEYARILFEKCELSRSKEAYLKALRLADAAGDITTVTDALAGLLRLAAEANDQEEIARWDGELERLIARAPQTRLPIIWYCRGIVAVYQHRARDSRRHLLRALRYSARLLADNPMDRELRQEFAKIWYNLAHSYLETRPARANWLADSLLKRFEAEDLRGVNGPIYMIKGMLDENVGAFDDALRWYQKAHATFLAERNWFAHIYVLYAYARVARATRNYTQAYWYLDLMDKASNGPEFGNLQEIVRVERDKLENDAVDLLIDSRACSVNTREAKGVALGKQYVLLGILEALTEAHRKDEPDSERGLSKAEIIERVWREKYRPEAHDNKLYYNINRLRKLIEPDMKHPKYLLNWKEGYRLSPGMKVHYVGGQKAIRGKNV